MGRKQYVLPIIVLAQFCCTSIWFAGNSVMGELINVYTLPSSALGHLTSAVQLGFILGTFVFALLTITDRFSPSKVFVISAVLAAFVNAGLIIGLNSFGSLIVLRVLTGFFLAGIYPVGMKIAADYFDKGLGKSLGYLVGALVLGTAFPHLLKAFSFNLNWEYVILFTSAIAILGGLLMFFLVPNGPYRKRSGNFDMSALFVVFKSSKMRSAALGYFGHMWELYAFWAFVPVILMTYNEAHDLTAINVPLWSFIIIGVGGPACVAGGYFSKKIGVKLSASIALFLSCLCCLLSPLIFLVNSPGIVLAFLIFWGATVVADSPLFSTLVANNTIAEMKGTALTIVNSIGFAITIISIQLLNYLHSSGHLEKYTYTVLAVGPILGLVMLLKRRDSTILTLSEK